MAGMGEDRNSSLGPGDGEIEDEEEEEIDDSGYKTMKDAVLFAIDVSHSMLVLATAEDSKKLNQDSAASAALKCAYMLMQQRIISHPNDMMGILLFGTEQSKFRDDEGESGGGYQYPHCYLLADLDVPDAADVKRLRNLAEDKDESQKLLVPSQEPVAMANVLFCANQIFTTRAPNFSSRRLFLVTDNDDPHARNKDLKSSAVVRAKDLYDLGVIIELFPISTPDHDFDRAKFYDDIVYRGIPSDPEAPAPVASAAKPSVGSDGISLLQSLLATISSKSVPRRAMLANIPLEFSPNLKITVKAFIIFKRQVPARSCYIWMDGETPQIAVGKTSRMADDTTRAVEKNEIRKAFKFGGESVMFTPEELSSLKHFGDPVIRILGFKPVSMLPIWANVRPSTFLYPSEEQYVGSSRTFSALQQTMLKKQKMAIVWYIARRNATPVLAALLPGAEKLGDHGEQVSPPGLWLVTLPFRDDMRDNPETKNVRAPDVLTDRMREVIQQLQLPKAVYDPERYPNPALQWHYRILQAMALEEDLPEKADDKTLPRYRQIHKRAGEYVLAWGHELQNQFQMWQKENTGQHAGAKRLGSQSVSAGSGPAKKTKAAEGAGITDEEMKQHYNKNTVSSLTVPILKDWAKGKGINIQQSKKAEVVERIEEYFENKMQLD